MKTAVAVIGVLIAHGLWAFPLGGKEWHGGPFGGGPGRVTCEQEGTNAFARLVKERGPGATQLFAKSPQAIGAAPRFKVSFLHRGDGGAFRWRLERKNAQGKYEILKNKAGKDLADYVSFSEAKDWTRVERLARVPSRLVDAANAVSLKVDVWGANAPKTLDVYDLRVETVAEEVPPTVPPVNVSLELAPKIEGLGAVPYLDHPQTKVADGLFLRNGKPFFWVGNGCDLGAEQATPVGLWLAKLLGYRAITLDPQGGLKVMKDEGTNAVLQSTVNTAGISHFRETARLGFFVDYFDNGVYTWSGLKPFAEKHPDFKEIHYNHGHYLDFDTGYPLGLELRSAKRTSFYENLDGLSHSAYLELCREPGPEPSNERAKRGFRAWAQRKYGTLAEACRVWRRSYPSWDAVVPLPLEENDIHGYMARILQSRKAKRDFPEFHYDWLQYLQDDFTACVAAERQALRAKIPNVSVTIDVRGHGIDTDGYCVLDPERIDPIMDVFSIHFGAHAYTYNQTPYDPAALADQTSFALFSYNFFRTNTEKPIFNAEDIVSTARVPGSDGAALAANDIGALHAQPWKFHLEQPGEDGLAKGWQKPGFDDAAWDTMAVPGCWDETETYKCKPGVAWYRRRFVAKANRQDWEDGSHRFLLYGKGVAQKGTIWLNGEKVGEVAGWDTRYEFDVSALLRYGQTNDLVFRVDGAGYQNGLRFYCHILPNDRINHAKRFGAQQYRMMLWPYLMHGTSGCWVWSWHNDFLRPHFPELVRKLEAASEVVLPDLRHRRGEVAYLYGFLNGRGLPCSIIGNHTDYLNWYNAIEFSGVRPDVFGERHFVKEIDPKRYRLLVVPYTKFVADDTYAAFKRYVLDGGTAVVTEGALERTFTRYAETDIRTFARIDAANGREVVETVRGKGRVVFVAGRPDMERLMTILKPYLPKPDIAVATSETREPPLVERVLAGDATRKILYLANWGGLDKDVTVTLPDAVRSWKLTPIESCTQGGPSLRDGEMAVRIPSQDVAVFLLEAPGSSAPALDWQVPAAQKAALDHVVKLNEPPMGNGPRALFPCFKQPHGVTPVGKELYPYVLDRLASFGVSAEEQDIETWTPELLKRSAVVVLPETNTQGFFRNAKKMKALGRMLDDYVRDGGALFVLAHTAYQVNNYAYTLTSWAGLAPSLGASLADGARDARHAGLGDPYQILTENLVPGPLTEGVRKVQLYNLRTLKASKQKTAPKAVPVVKIPVGAESGADAAAMMAVEHGKGRMFLSADAMAFQPFRIELADNAALLENIVGWLLNRPVTPEMRDAFRANLAISF